MNHEANGQMKLLRKGEYVTKLQCHCGKVFTTDVNKPEEATCPDCECKWNGLDNHPGVPPMRYFMAMVGSPDIAEKLKERPEMDALISKKDETEPMMIGGIGEAFTIQEFISRHIWSLPEGLTPSTLYFREIDYETYIEAKEGLDNFARGMAMRSFFSKLQRIFRDADRETDS